MERGIMGKKSKYYDIRHLFKKYPSAQYYVVYGERSNGKTYSSLDYCLEKYFNNCTEKFAYIRRYSEDVKRKKMIDLFSSHVEHGRITQLTNGNYSLVDYNEGKFWVYNYDEKTRKKETFPDPMGYVFDLISMEHFKSLAFPEVTTIIFDEFLSRTGYWPNEFILFMNTLSTIIRDRKNVKIIMLGNTVNKTCPYFREMGLTHIRNQKPGTIDIYKYGESQMMVVAERTDTASRTGGKESDIYFAFDNPQLKMITTGEWEIGVYPHLQEKYTKADVVLTFFIIFEMELLECDIVCKSNIFIFIHPRTAQLEHSDNDFIYQDGYSKFWNHRTGLTNQNDKLSLEIRRIFNENRVFYSDNETGEVVRNFLEWSTTYSATEGMG